MLVVLHFHQLGFSPLQIASLFLFYEIFGVVTNLVGGYLGARLGMNKTMNIGLALQVIALMMLVVPTTLLTVPWVMDVNLGVHLVRDALMKKMDHAAVITNDTDLCEPLRIVVEDAKMPLTLMSPVPNPADKLKKIATYVRHIDGYLGAAQFPDPVVDKNGKQLTKPAGW